MRAPAAAKAGGSGSLWVADPAGVLCCGRLLCVTDPARYCSKAARALIREMFGLAVELAPQGCFLPPAQQDDVRAPPALGVDLRFRVLAARDEASVLGAQQCTTPKRSLRQAAWLAGWPPEARPYTSTLHCCGTLIWSKMTTCPSRQLLSGTVTSCKTGPACCALFFELKDRRLVGVTGDGNEWLASQRHSQQP